MFGPAGGAQNVGHVETLVLQPPLVGCPPRVENGIGDGLAVDRQFIHPVGGGVHDGAVNPRGILSQLRVRPEGDHQGVIGVGGEEVGVGQQGSRRRQRWARSSHGFTVERSMVTNRCR